MAPTKEEVVELYRKRAHHYNITANLYYLLGFREWKYRKRAVQELNLKPGDTVVEIGCGTGLNFPLLQKKIGPTGKIIGVDLADAMLDETRRRIQANGWSNAEAVQSDAATFSFPPNINGILSTFALTLVPEFDAVIRNGSLALIPGGRWAILDLKIPSNWLYHLSPLFNFLVKPFGATRDLMSRHPWESLHHYLNNFTFVELYMGFAYIASGEASRSV